MEPDSDGWICERCWINLTNPIMPVVQLAISVSVSVGQPVLQQKCKNLGVDRQYG